MYCAFCRLIRCICVAILIDSYRHTSKKEGEEKFHAHIGGEGSKRKGAHFFEKMKKLGTEGMVLGLNAAAWLMTMDLRHMFPLARDYLMNKKMPYMLSVEID